jgi:tetratricopeptide (TPR) repeat protein
LDVFLSHNRRDGAVVEQIARALSREGISSWLDVWCVTPGGIWQDELAEGLAASASCAVFIGPDDIGPWERLELGVALDRAAQDRAYRVFPVLLPGLERFDPDMLPLFLRGRTCVDFGEGVDSRRALRDLVHAIKGIPVGPVDRVPAAPMPAESTVSTPAPLPLALRPRGGGSLYGRDQELERLRAWWRDVGSGVRLCVLSGKAGIGKTRLAGELAREARMGGASVLYGRCDDDPLFPYQPFVEALRHRFAYSVPTAGPDLAAELGELSRLVPELRRGGFSPAPSAVEDPALRRRQVFDAVGAVLTEVATADGGVLLVLDDLHAADRQTAALLRYVLRLDVKCTLAILAVHRDRELSPDHPVAEVLEVARREGFRERVILSGLPLDAVGRLAAALVPQRASARFLQGLHARTAGNPLLIEELLLEVTALPRVDQRAIELDDLAAAGVPETVKDVVARRLARLGLDVARVLTEAAVIGPQFRLGVLEELRPDADPLLAVEAALEAGLLVEQRPGGWLAFPHQLLHQAIYDSQSVARRARVHRQVAQVLARRPELGGGDEELARHWAAAGEAGPALVASLKAARTAREVAAFAEALRHYEVALQFWPLTGDAAGEDRRDVLEAAAEAARWAGLPGRAVELVREALALADAPADHARGARLQERLGRYLWEKGDFGASLHEYERISGLPDALPPSVEAAQTLAGQALTCMFRERFGAAREYARRALEIARTVGARREEGHAMNTLGVALGMSGRTEEGLAALREALAIAEDLEHLEDQCRAYVNLSELLTRFGRTGQAATVALDGYRFARARGLSRSGAPIVGANAVVALTRLGRWDEAEALADEALAGEPPDGTCVYLRIVHGRLLVLRGELDAGRAQLARSEAIVKLAYEPELTADLAVTQAELALIERRPADARVAAQAGLDALTRGDGDGQNDDEPGENDLRLRLLAVAMRIVPDPDTAADRTWRERAAAHARDVALELKRHEALLPVAAALAATIEAEHARLVGEPGLSGRWAAVARRWETIEDVHATARARLAQADALCAEGDIARARLGLAEVAAIARRLGAVPLEREVVEYAARVGLSDVIESLGGDPR